MMVAGLQAVAAVQPWLTFTCCCGATAAHLLGSAHAAAEGRIDGAELKPAVGGKAASSQCAKDCIAKATQLGYAKVANESMACFLPSKGKRLSTSDCCDKV
jgi:hypothetical protein